MDAVDDLRVSGGRMRWRGARRQQKEEEEVDDEELVELLLQGKAPWGFTVRGGTEHREPLVITKVEEGSVAAAVCLQVGDEMVSVNAVPLSGSRQEAITLVKSSHKTLTLVVVRRQRYTDKPSCDDAGTFYCVVAVVVVVAVVFRAQRGEIGPHSAAGDAAAVVVGAGNTSKLAKMVDVVTPRTMPSETEVHVARSFLTKILRSSMRKNDPGSRPHSWHSSKLTEEESAPAKREATPAPVWQPKHEARPKESSAQEDQDTQHQLSSQFSSANNMERLERPSHRLSPTKYIGSTEPLCAPGGKRDSGLSCFSSSSSPPVHDSSTSGRKGTSTENIFFKGLQGEAERPRYLQPTLGNGGWEGSRAEDQPASRVSTSGRPSFGPVWQVPEKKKSQSPPPPPPPLRSDSFAATKVFPYSEGISGPAKSKGRSFEKLTENNEQNSLRSHQEKTSDARHSFNPLPSKDFLHPNMAADHNHNQLHTNKLFSLSSSDVRQSHYTQPPAHQRQYSDESPLYLQTRSAPPTKIQSVGSYYRSLQDLPTNAFSRKQVRHSSNQENGAPNRYHSLAGKHSVQTGEFQARQGKAENLHWVSSNEQGFPSSSKSNIKGKYSLPQLQMPHRENKERNGNSHLGNGLHFDHQTSELPIRSCSPEETAKRSEGHSNDMKRHFPTDHKVSFSRQQDPWVPQEDQRISPLKTPLLHSLAQESRTLADRQTAAMTTCVMSPQDVSDIMAANSGKTNRRSDRYATTLRNEIQQKRAQLQKSRSAATLSCEVEEEEEEVADWRSTMTSTSSGVSFSNTYKDHLKEAQARVLQATSFQRRDLEPLGPEPPVVKAPNGRIRGRKRFPLAKKMHSFSEPDKIDKVGVEGEPQAGSFGERRKFFEGKPTFSRPVLKSSQGTNLNADLGETGKSKETSEEDHGSADPNHLSPGYKQVLLEQQRLGTFAEYQATWNQQKKSSEAKKQGRYHSAENILDADAEEKAVCIHERSRSSPSADFNTQEKLRAGCSINPTTAHSWSPKTRARSQASLTTGPNQMLPVPPTPLTPRALVASAPTLALITRPSFHKLRSFLPPPRPLLGPETTSSSQEFLAGAQADPATLQPLSSSGYDTQRRNASSPHLSATSGGVENEEAGEQPQPPPSSSSLFSSWTGALSLPADRARSPSPQFAPLRLTDQPPAVFVQDDSPLRSDDDLKLPSAMDVKGPVRKVPVRIVHAESSSEREGKAYLPQSSDTCSAFEPPTPPPSSLSTTERPASSLFSAYTRQDLPQAPPEAAPELNPAEALRSEEDAKREELARDIMGKDKSLVDILDQSGRMTTMDLMEGLFPPEEQILEGALQRKTSRLPNSSPRSMERREEDDVSVSAAASLVPSSSYYNTSAPKAELLIKMKDMQEQLEEQDSEDELDVDLASKKQELISSLAGKLEVLREARHSLQEDVEDNEALGREVEATVQRLCQPNQLDKFRMFVGDLDKVVSLLLSLSGRLARVENALNSLEEEAPPEEKRTLTEKRKLLMRQHEDAKELKENLDRRERLVSGIMEAHLDAESLDDYRHFVKMKSALIIEQRKLEDKIKLGEEQLKCLVDSLPLEQRPLF
ncbi:Protein Shroom2 [Collichthys lucidus]|uniref:Protein Shroom2 n=1 Tax=Collichthys lucidus TaxID=240159 RepID=A0A4U5TYG7_COLLU|nr:Protein Shroom2 [Collichthys lucidus]